MTTLDALEVDEFADDWRRWESQRLAMRRLDRAIDRGRGAHRVAEAGRMIAGARAQLDEVEAEVTTAAAGGRFACCWHCGGVGDLPCTDVAEAGPHVEACEEGCNAPRPRLVTS